MGIYPSYICTFACYNVLISSFPCFPVIFLLSELRRDNEDWTAQYMARQLYIKHETKQLYKAVIKAHEMWDKAEALRREFIPTRRNGQQLLNFIDDAKP